MKILHIITRLEAGGSSANTLESAADQSKEHEVALVRGPHPAGLAAPAGLRIIEIPTLAREISPLDDLRSFFALYRLISEMRPGIVHTHTSKAGMLGRWAARLANLGAGRNKALIVHTPHGHVLYGYFGPFKAFCFQLLERLTARITDRFIALTEGEKRESVAAGIGPAGKWTVIHSGVRFNAREHAAPRRPMGNGELVVATIARLEPVKGVEYFIRAAAELRKMRLPREPRFLIAGDGALREELAALSASLGLADILTFAGFQRDVFAFLAGADIYIQPSLNEAMGRTVIEAQYMGLPVVASRVCGLPDALLEGTTGLLVPPADPAALAAAAASLVRDDGLRRRLGDAAGQWVRKRDFTGHARFSAESMNERLKTFYNGILSGRTDGGA